MVIEYREAFEQIANVMVVYWGGPVEWSPAVVYVDNTTEDGFGFAVDMVNVIAHIYQGSKVYRMYKAEGPNIGT